MSRRIDIELTSTREDGSWTWRAAGAREPKGTISSDLLPASAAVGDELRVEADFFVDGIEITAVMPPKGERKEPETLEVLGPGSDQVGGVTTSLVPKRDRGRGDRRGRGRSERGGDRPRGDRQERGGRGDRGGRGRSEVRERRPERPPPPAKPKPKKLRAQRTHRNTVLASLPEEQRPIAEQVLRGGIPGVRKAVEEQNTRNKAEGRPEIDAAPLVQLAETLLPGLKEAEWHDRADAAIAGIDEVDLRDLRAVVVAAESSARSEATRTLAEQLREAVAARVDREHAIWLREMTQALDDERTVRALRMSSRPPKAGSPLPPELAARLVEAANVSLTDDTGPQRWATVLDAVAYSPIRSSVVPQGIPSRPNDELLDAVRHLSTRVPEIAALFGIEPQKAPRRRKPKTARTPKKKQASKAAPPPRPRDGDRTASETDSGQPRSDGAASDSDAGDAATPEAEVGAAVGASEAEAAAPEAGTSDAEAVVSEGSEAVVAEGSDAEAGASEAEAVVSEGSEAEVGAAEVGASEAEAVVSEGSEAEVGAAEVGASEAEAVVSEGSEAEAAVSEAEVGAAEVGASEAEAVVSEGSEAEAAVSEAAVPEAEVGAAEAGASEAEAVVSEGSEAEVGAAEVGASEAEAVVSEGSEAESSGREDQGPEAAASGQAELDAGAEPGVSSERVESS